MNRQTYTSTALYRIVKTYNLLGGDTYAAWRGGGGGGGGI